MRKQLIRAAVFAVILFASSLRAQFSPTPVTPTDWSFTAWRSPAGIHAKPFPVSIFSPFYETWQPSRVALGNVKLYATQMSAHRTMRFTSNGIPFDHGAVFCRMENHCLRNYNFKFSIHAGGYKE